MLDKNRLKTKIKQALDNESDAVVDPVQARDRTADKIAQAVVDELKQLKITYVAGLIAPSGGGAVTGTWTITLS